MYATRAAVFTSESIHLLLLKLRRTSPPLVFPRTLGTAAAGRPDTSTADNQAFRGGYNYNGLYYSNFIPETSNFGRDNQIGPANGEIDRNPNRPYRQNFDLQSHNLVGSGYAQQSVAAIDANPIEPSQLRSTVDDLDQLIKERKLKEAVQLLGDLQNEGIMISPSLYISLMKLCGELECIDEAKSVHNHLLRSGAPIEIKVYNRILEMYSKCGSMNEAFQVFDQMPQRNLTSWDIMILWLAKNGHGEDSIDLFSELKKSGLKPDGQMFISVFSACGAVSDVFEGMLHFESMMKDYNIAPTMDHYVSIVEMLGSASCVDEAFEFIEKLEIEPTVEIWETLLKFCRIHGFTELGDKCVELIDLLDPSRLNDQSRAGIIPIKASDIAIEKEKKKLNSLELLGVRSMSHEYRAGDKSHSDQEKIYALLWGLKHQMKEVGYVPMTKLVLHDVDDEVREESLMAHSERLAVAKGFLTSPARSPMRIIKNLRVCNDCHNVFKIISAIVGRKIIMRDPKRFHHFENGSCNCNDFW